MGRVPDGHSVPVGGPLVDRVVETQRLSIYLHVPFCAVRCGYCDFNTYTAEELQRDGVVSSRETYIRQAVQELRMARTALGDRDIVVPTVFVGGGTPTLLRPEALAEFFAEVQDSFALAPDAEITVEANPDTLDAAYLDRLRAAGATRLSIGMQSAVPHVLSVLERTHNPANVERAVHAAKASGFEQVSVDLIYGAPGESLDDWRRTVDVATSLPIDHVSAYALIVEEGTRLANQIERGQIEAPDDDLMAEKYLVADAAFTADGLAWYEVSNWAKPAGECRHNLAYWRSADWWGIGPGAHSHVDGVRWWNVKHPSAYAARLATGQSPAQAREVLTPEHLRTERVMLALRLAEGLGIDELRADQMAIVEQMAVDDLVVIVNGSIVLTRAGRLLADAVIRDLITD